MSERTEFRCDEVALVVPVRQSSPPVCRLAEDERRSLSGVTLHPHPVELAPQPHDLGGLVGRARCALGACPGNA